MVGGIEPLFPRLTVRRSTGDHSSPLVCHDEDVDNPTVLCRDQRCGADDRQVLSSAELVLNARSGPRTEPCGEILVWPYVTLGTKRENIHCRGHMYHYCILHIDNVRNYNRSLMLYGYFGRHLLFISSKLSQHITILLNYNHRLRNHTYRDQHHNLYYT